MQLGRPLPLVFDAHGKPTLEALARVEVFDWQENKRTIEHAGDKHKGLVERLEFSPAGDWRWVLGSRSTNGWTR